MQTQSKKFLILSVLFVTFLGGCKKNQKKSDGTNTSSKVSSKMKRNKKSSHAADAFDLDQDSMKSFALDDQIAQHKSAANATPATSENSMFSWENLNAEESKHQFKTLHFGFDKDDLAATEHAALSYDIAEAKKMIKQGKIIVIEGHACHSAGSAIYNLALSERRARYVAQKFAEEGIDASHIKIAPRGQEMPVKKGGSKAEQWVNRRVEIYAIDAK